MRIVLLTTLTMIAFATNSILNRIALVDGAIDPASYAFVRLLAGAVMLWAILALRGDINRDSFRPNMLSVLGLASYAIGFSFAYLTLDTGLGALLLFGGVQLTMFIGAMLFGRTPNALQWLGAGIGFLGLAYLLNPATSEIDPLGGGLMLLAALGWGVYTLLGQRVTNPRLAAAQSFGFAVPIALIVLLFVGVQNVSFYGLMLAILSGAGFSGLGYLMWFSVLPKLSTSTAAVAQLTVPLIAAFGGAIFLSEPLTFQFAVASCLVLGGVALTIWAGHLKV